MGWRGERGGGSVSLRGIRRRTSRSLTYASGIHNIFVGEERPAPEDLAVSGPVVREGPAVAVRDLFHGEALQRAVHEGKLSFDVSHRGKSPACSHGPLVLHAGHGAMIAPVPGRWGILDRATELETPLPPRHLGAVLLPHQDLLGKLLLCPVHELGHPEGRGTPGPGVQGPGLLHVRPEDVEAPRSLLDRAVGLALVSLEPIKKQ